MWFVRPDLPRFILFVSLFLLGWAPTAGGAAPPLEPLFHIYVLDTRLLRNHDSDVRLYMKLKWRNGLDQGDPSWKEPARHRGLLVAKTPGKPSASMIAPIDGDADSSGKAIDDHIDMLKLQLPPDLRNGYIDIGDALKAARDDVKLVLGQLAQRVRDTNTPQRLTFVVHFLGDDLRFRPPGSNSAIPLRDYEMQKSCFTGAGLNGVVTDWANGFEKSHLARLSIHVFTRLFGTEGLPPGMLEDVASATTGHSTMLGQPLSFLDRLDMLCESESQAPGHPVTGTCGQSPIQERKQKTERVNCFRPDTEEGKRLEARRRAAITAAVSGAPPRKPGVAGAAGGQLQVAGVQPQPQPQSQSPAGPAIRPTGPGATPPPSPDPVKAEPPKPEPPKPEPAKQEPPAPSPPAAQPGQTAQSTAQSNAAPPPSPTPEPPKTEPPRTEPPAPLPPPAVQPGPTAPSAAIPTRKRSPSVDSVFRRGVDAPPFRTRVEITVLEADPPGIERSIAFAALPDRPAPGGAGTASPFRIEASTATDKRVSGEYTLAIEPRDRLQCRLDNSARLRLVVTGIAVEGDSRGTYDVTLHDICGYADSTLPFGRMNLR
ncbi:hypothetical protein [Azospirillum largimobile]